MEYNTTSGKYLVSFLVKIWDFAVKTQTARFDNDVIGCDVKNSNTRDNTQKTEK